MKIAMIGQKGIPSRAGGVEIHVEEISARLVELGHGVTVYCRKSYCKDRPKMYRGIKLKYIPSISTKHLDAIIYSFIATLHALLENYDIYHYHALGPSTVSWIPRLFGKKVVCTVHGLDWQRQKWGKFASKYLKFGEYASCRFSNELVSVSETLAKYFKKKYNKDPFYIPNGINIPQKKPANIITYKYGLQKEEYILFLARLVPEKGAHYLIEAFKNINTNKKLVIAGGSSHSDDYVKSLHDLAGGSEKIIFTDFVEGDLLNELFSNAFLYILPSDVEGMPISLLEAMSYGLVCLVSDIDENLSVIKEYGFSFKRGDVKDIEKRLTLLLSDSLSFEEKKKVISKYIVSDFDWARVTMQLEEVYTNTLDQSAVCNKVTHNLNDSI